MTTMVTVDAANHDVEVQRLLADGSPSGPVELVPKGDKRVFYAHQQQDISVKEVKDA